MKTQSLPLLLPLLAAACGGSSGGSVTTQSNPPPTVQHARWAYSANVADDTLSAYGVEAETGRLMHRGYYRDPAAYSGPQEVIVHPNHPSLYAPNLRDAALPSNLSVFTVDPDSGALAARAPVEIGVGPHSMRLSPNGRTAYVTNSGDNDVRVFLVDDDTGDLAPLGTHATGAGPWTLGVDPKGRFLYVGNRFAATISIFQVDAGTGGLVGPPDVFTLNGALPFSMAVDESGSYLLVTTQNFQLLLSFSIDPQTGELQTVDAASIAEQPGGLAFGAGGEVVYVASRDEDTLTPFAFDPQTGSIGPPGAPVPTGENPNGITLDEGGSRAYVACDGSDEVVVFDLADPLVPVEVDRYRAREAPRVVGLVHGDEPLRPRAKALYTLNRDPGAGGGSLTTFNFDSSDGSLSNAGGDVLTGQDPSCLTVGPFGSFVYVTLRGDDAVQTFSISPSHELVSSGPPEPVAADPVGVAADPSGSYLFVTSASTDVVESYRTPFGGGSWAKIDEHATLSQPGAVAVDPTGRFLFVANEGSATITAYRLDGGIILAEASSAPAPTRSMPSALAFSAGGDQLYASTPGASPFDLVIAYTIDNEDGDLTLAPPGAEAKSWPTAVAVHPLLPRAYAALNDPAGSGGVATYVLDPATGRPTFLNTVAVGLNPKDLVLDPLGGFLFVANQGGQDVTLFAVNGAGDLILRGFAPTGSAPTSLDLLRAFD